MCAEFAAFWGGLVVYSEHCIYFFASFLMSRLEIDKRRLEFRQNPTCVSSQKRTSVFGSRLAPKIKKAVSHCTPSPRQEAVGCSCRCSLRHRVEHQT